MNFILECLSYYDLDNVLQLMNSRLLVNKWLTINEILDIFCDVSEAVCKKKKSLFCHFKKFSKASPLQNPSDSSRSKGILLVTQ